MQKSPGPYANDLTVCLGVGKNHPEGAITGDDYPMMRAWFLRGGMHKGGKKTQGQQERVQDVQNFKHKDEPPGLREITTSRPSSRLADSPSPTWIKVNITSPLIATAVIGHECAEISCDASV
jgi:hypothetical protein